MADDIRVTAFLHAKPGQEAAVMQAALACIAPTRAELGNETYVLHQDMEEPALFVFVEHWKSKQALDEHMQTLHFKQLGDACDGKLVEPMVVHILKPL